MKKRGKKGLYANLILELPAEDPLGFREIIRMSRDQFHEILGKIGPLTVIGQQYNMVERTATRFNIYCVLEKMFDRNQNILPTKNVE